MTNIPQIRIDPDAGIPDLIRRLTEDSRRLAGDEVRLAKLELHDSMNTGVRGATQIAVALAVGIVAAVALTVLLIAVVGVIANRNYWVGALVIGAAELIAGWILLRRGTTALKERSYTLDVSRAALKDTATWIRHPTTH
ncbi:MAG TPA: phage holin family protein [Gemmatimonadaceae bacterium]|nr:phage holin family protein [Gemmatimonadaceae bacterium]